MVHGGLGREGGFAVPLVMWTLALLGVLAAGLAVETRSKARLDGNRSEAARAGAVADAGFAIALAGLLDPKETVKLDLAGAPRQVEYGGGHILVAIQDEAGKVDLNEAPTTLLGGLFGVLGLDAGDRETLLAGIIARRRAVSGESDESPKLYGVPDRMTAFDPAKAPFAAVSELRLIGGVGESVYKRVLPFVTVYARTARINPATASREVLAAVPGLDAAQADALIAGRAAPAVGGAGRPAPVLSSAAAFLGAGDLHAVTIEAAATTAGGAAYLRTAVVELAPDAPIHPYRILDWRQGAAGD